MRTFLFAVSCDVATQLVRAQEAAMDHRTIVGNANRLMVTLAATLAVQSPAKAF